MARQTRPRPPARPRRAPAPVQAGGWSVASILFIAVGLLIYSNSFDVPMQFDDVTHIVQSKDLHDLRAVERWWNHDPRRPIGYLSLALNHHFSGLRVGSYHAINVGIHILNALLVYWLVRLTLATSAMAGSVAGRHRNTMALLAGLLFLVHPIQTQAVTYIIQRLASQATLFYLLALVLYVKGRLWRGRPVLRPIWYVGSGLAGVAGMLTKETVFTLPLAILLYEFCFLSSGDGDAPSRRRWAWLAGVGVAGLLILPALMAFDLSRVFKTIPPEHGELFTLTPANYALTQPRVILKYLQLFALPMHQNLDHDVAVFDSPWQWPTLAALAVIAGILALAVMAYRRRRLLSFGILWFFLTLSVESSFLPINDVMFEHRLYLPMLGLVLVVVDLLMRRGVSPAIGVLSAAALLLGIATYRRNEVWRDPVTLWRDTAAKSPNKARPQTNLGAQYLERGELALARAPLERAVEINPEYALAHLNLGAYYQRAGQTGLAERHFLRAAELTPGDSRPDVNLGVLYLEVGRTADAEAALLKALARDTTAAFVHAQLGVSWFMRGDDDRAIHHSSRAIELDPRQYDALNNLGRAWRRKGDLGKARQYYEGAIEVEPQSTEALSNLGNLALAEGKPQEAEGLYRRALAINPGYAGALNGIGVMHYQRGEYATAREYFADAARQNPRNADALNNLGLCYGREGRLDLAIEYFRRALEVRPTFEDARRNLEAAVGARGGA